MGFTSTLYERNLFYQQLNFKYLLILYLQSILWKHKPRINGTRNVILTLSFILVYLLDFMLGVISLLYIIKHPSVKSNFEDIISLYIKTSLEWCSDYIIWLTGVPWGIKLNTPLSQFLGTRYLIILDLWKLFYSEFIALYLSIFINIFFSLLPFGVTFTITALHDFLKFLNLCLICFFVISHRIFALQVSALKSLGRLFMGRKWNILRKRVDSYDFDMNQLLFGTVIFTILLFLLPTTGMYMLAFLYLRLIQFAVQFALRVSSVLVNRITIWGVRYIDRAVQDQPITQSRVLIRGLSPTEYASRKIVSPYQTVDGKHCKVEFFPVDDADITVKWNGVEYPVDEMRRIMKTVPVEVIKKELKGESDDADGDSVKGRIINHPMMYLFWSLPKN